MTRALAMVVLLNSLACSTRDPGTTAASEGTTATTSTSPSSTSASTSTAATSEAPTSTDSGNFAAMPDLPAPGVACDPWQPSCPEGQKCKPRADGFGPWDDASCVPIADPPIPTGGACLDPEWSITDECQQGTVCHGFLADEGRRCHELCGGSWMAPTCSDACSVCMKNGAVAGVCLFPCDPRDFGCPEGQKCDVLVTAPRFACAPGPGQSGAGQSCAASPCVDGTVCVDAALVPDCADTRCCAPVCTVAAPDTCAAALPGTACSEWPMSGPDFEPQCLPANLGLCAAN